MHYDDLILSDRMENLPDSSLDRMGNGPGRS